ncbi:putative inactive heme oxygenase 2, chloroplastic [Dichanthelium oligosanthes]|uniref:Putative inactive heme oxygenase 2, chloroplastic n=1 Tax=Dichanthelium oligosanthes TaxID=888268 RepID=A0A1E5VEG3_9POAL|nr:putative inactive heme oxygenase 2, chloroplastic [Dichanthelium oligosanthes]
MPLVVAAAAAASAVAPPPSRRVVPLLSLRPPRTGAQAQDLTLARCSPSPSAPAAAEAPAPPQEAKPKPKPRRYPKQYPGEAVGVAEEMRFVAMRLRNPKRTTIKDEPGEGDADAGPGSEASEDDDGGGVKEENEMEEESGVKEGEWMPSMEGFLRYLVDSKLVFDTIERVVAESTDVAYVYFRKSGLERSASISKDLEWFREQGIEIPEPSTLGSTYATYLTELAESNAPAFLSHYYNIFFAHITGGVAIGNKVTHCMRQITIFLLSLKFCLNRPCASAVQHWTRKDRNLCLKEAVKCFQYLGKMVRLIIS